MGMSTLMNIGSRAMSASYAQLEVTGNNIANANTPGYSRQSAALETSFSQQSGSGFFGKGVDVATVVRQHNDFLTREVATTRSLAAADQARRSQLEQLESIFPTGESGLGQAAQKVFDTFVDISNNPQDSAARQVALGRIGDLAGRLRNAGSQLDALQANASGELTTAVTAINAQTRTIADLNRQIANAQSSGHTANDLLDKRDRAISELSQYVQVTTVASADGTVSVFLGGAQKLVLGGEATALTTVADAYDPTRRQLGISEGGVARAFPDGFVNGGSVGGLLRFQNHDLADARALLGQYASAIAGGLNRQQALGVDLRQPSSPGGPLLSITAASVAPSSNNARSGGVPVASTIDSNGARVSSVSISVVDSRQLLASDYELVADPSLPAGSYQLTRLSDGQQQTVSNGTVVDGFRIDIAAPAPAARDRFLLQPVSQATRSIGRALDDPSGIAAASPVVGLVSPANAGTATVASLAAVDPAINPNLTTTFTFTDDVGGYATTTVDSTGVVPTSSGTGVWTPGQPITLNGFELRLSGGPKTGDVVTVGRNMYPASDNGNANAMVRLGQAPIVGQRMVGGVTVPGMSVTEAYAQTLATVGVRVQSAQLAADQSASIAAQAKTAEAATSGVNLDEEAARLIQFQQSYQAAAKILQIAQSVFDTLAQIAR